LVHNLFSAYFINFIYDLYMFQTSLGPSSGGTTVRHPTPYTSWIVSMNTAPLETPWHYSNLLTYRHFSYHTNSCTYNYSIITINSSQNIILMNKILCSNYFTIDILRQTPPWHSNQYLHLNMAQPVSFHPAYHIVSYTGTSTDISTILLLHYL